jgi:hypothetical protein
MVETSTYSHADRLASYELLGGPELPQNIDKIG